MNVHELKSWPEYFAPLWEAHKTFEIRWEDRGFAVGDLLWLREWLPPDNLADTDEEDMADPARYTGKHLLVRITDITAEHPGLATGYVALSVEFVRLVPLSGAEVRINAALRAFPEEVDSLTPLDKVVKPAE